MREVLDDHISPNELARKYSIPAHAIRDWIKKAGHSLPKSYKRFGEYFSILFNRIIVDRSHKVVFCLAKLCTEKTLSLDLVSFHISWNLNFLIPRTLKTNNQQQQQGNVQLPTTPLPPGQVSGVAVGDPPSIESPPALEVGSLMPNSSPAGSNVSNTSYQQTPSKRVPGKLALCTRCGTQSDDISTCVRCKRKLPDDVKLLDDPTYKPKPDSTENGTIVITNPGAKKVLRNVRLPSKSKKRNNADEPVCIALSDSEDDGDADMEETETIDDNSGKNIKDVIVPRVLTGELQLQPVCIVYIGTIEADKIFLSAR